MDKTQIVSRLMSAIYMVPFFLYIKFMGAFVLGQLYFRMPFSLVTELTAVVVAYLLVELTIGRWKASLLVKGLTFVGLVTIPILAARILLG